MSTETTQTAPEAKEESNRPTHVGKVRHGRGNRATYDQVGVAWANDEDGTLYFKPYGTQIIAGPVIFYPIER